MSTRKQQVMDYSKRHHFHMGALKITYIENTRHENDGPKLQGMK